jgi:uncharacterized protein YbjT (DUF2867 family)
MKKAIVFGATGFIGSHLVQELLSNPDYDQVVAVVRKKLNLEHSKLKVLIGNLQTLPNLKGSIVADDVFIALGTTRKLTPDRSQYYQIDHDYPLLAAKIAKENGAKAVFLVSAVGANANSKVFYVKTKGEVERDITALNYPYTHIFRPSMILGNRQEDRPMERVYIKIWNAINPLLFAKLNIYRGLKGEDIAKAMNRAAKQSKEKMKIYHWQEMHDLL